MCGTTARVMLNTPTTLVSSTSATSSSSIAASWLSRMMPALLTRMSMRPAAFDNPFDGGRAGCRVAHVDLFRRDVRPPRIARGHDFRGGGGIVAIEERDVGALGGEQLDDRPADAAAAAGHDRHLPARPESEVIVMRLVAQPEMQKPPSTTSVWPLIIAASGRQSR